MQKQIGPDGNKDGCGKTASHFFLYEKEYKSASYIKWKTNQESLMVNSHLACVQ